MRRNRSKRGSLRHASAAKRLSLSFAAVGVLGSECPNIGKAGSYPFKHRFLGELLIMVEFHQVTSQFVESPALPFVPLFGGSQGCLASPESQGLRMLWPVVLNRQPDGWNPDVDRKSTRL